VPLPRASLEARGRGTGYYFSGRGVSGMMLSRCRGAEKRLALVLKSYMPGPFSDCSFSLQNYISTPSFSYIDNTLHSACIASIVQICLLTKLLIILLWLEAQVQVVCHIQNHSLNALEILTLRASNDIMETSHSPYVGYFLLCRQVEYFLAQVVPRQPCSLPRTRSLSAFECLFLALVLTV